MVTRELPPSEWARLQGMDLAEAVPYLVPDRDVVLVVEDGDRIVGCWALVTVRHAEGVWIHPDYRGKTSVARRLWVHMGAIARRLGVSRVVTGADDPGIARLLERHGAEKLSMESYVMAVNGGR